MRELDLLHHIYAASGGVSGGVPGVPGVPGGALAGASGRVTVGPGDDMAMVRLDGRDLLAAVDQIVEGRHFRLGITPIDLVGRKAVTRCLSDVAAMAGRPVAALAAATLPPDFGVDRAKALFDAMRVTAERYECPLIGGDISIHEGDGQPLVCAITVLAAPGQGPGSSGQASAGQASSGQGVPVLRSGACVGDTLYVTGRLGGSGGDGQHHLTFEPRLIEARALAGTLGERLHAMIDISDGLGRDAAHVARASGVRIEIDASAIPANAGLDWRRAASDGEDYELLFTASGVVPDSVRGELPVTAIGRVVPYPADEPGASRVVFIDGSTRIDGDELGWEHEA